MHTNIKIKIGKTGEIRRPNFFGRILKNGGVKENERIFYQALIEECGENIKWITYIDQDGDTIFFPFGASDGLTTAVHFSDKGPSTRSHLGQSMTLTVHESKEEALLEIANSSAKHVGRVEDLGEYPEKLVALDLRIPLLEATELIRRARGGDEIARRVVLPSRFSLREFDSNVFKDDDAFESELAAKGVVTKHVVHWGVACDKSNMSPIVGVRYHLPGRDYDLCEAEFEKLSPQDKLAFVAIKEPRSCASRPTLEQPQQHQEQEQFAPPAEPDEPACPEDMPKEESPQQERPSPTDRDEESDDDFTVVNCDDLRRQNEENQTTTNESPDTFSRARAVELLKSMGFTDEDECARLLDRHASFEEVVEILVEEDRVLRKYA